MHRFFLLVMSLFCILKVQALEYLYPVAYLSQTDQLCCMYQNQEGKLQVVVTQPDISYAYPALLSRFCPASITFLPNQQVFSFIDNGIVKIKDLLKRSPRSFDFSQPLYDFVRLHWINNQVFYAQAKKGGKYGVFCVHQSGYVCELLWDGKYDYCYPQIVGTTLFCIKRTVDHSDFEIVSFLLDKQLASTLCINDQIENNCEKLETFFCDINDNKFFCATTGQYSSIIKKIHPVLFLKAFAESELYYISHHDKQEQESEYLEFQYKKLEKKENTWHEECLFEFCLPSKLLFGDNPSRLFESILPLAPKHVESNIYFSSTDMNNQATGVSLYRYDTQKKQAYPVLQSTTLDQHYFSPVQIGNKIISGGTLNKEGGVYFEYVDNGAIKLFLPVSS